MVDIPGHNTGVAGKNPARLIAEAPLMKGKQL